MIVLQLSQNPITEAAAMAALDFIATLEDLHLQVLDLGVSVGTRDN